MSTRRHEWGEWGIAVLRVSAAVPFIVHGSRYLRIGGVELARRGLATYQFPDSQFTSAIIVVLVPLCGAALLLGLFARWAAVLLAAFQTLQAFLSVVSVTARGAPLAVVMTSGFLPPSVVEYWWVLALLTACSAVAGPGAVSIDAVILKRRRDEERLRGWAVTAVRLSLGIVFLVHGVFKLVAYGFPYVAAQFVRLGLRAAMISAVVVTLAEILGGVALLLGLHSRWAAAILAAEMAVAVVLALGQGYQLGFNWPGGYEYGLLLLGASAAVAISGPGAFAFEGRHGCRSPKPNRDGLRSC